MIGTVGFDTNYFNALNLRSKSFPIPFHKFTKSGRGVWITPQYDPIDAQTLDSSQLSSGNKSMYHTYHIGPLGLSIPYSIYSQVISLPLFQSEQALP